MSSVEFHALCVEVGLGLGCHVVIGVGRVVVHRHHADAKPSVESFLLNLAVHFCTCSQTVFCDRQFIYSQIIAHFSIAKTGHLRCCLRSSKTKIWSQLHTYHASNWLQLPIRARFWCFLGSNLSVPMLLRLLVMYIHDRPLHEIVKDLQCLSSWIPPFPPPECPPSKNNSRPNGHSGQFGGVQTDIVPINHSAGGHLGHLAWLIPVLPDIFRTLAWKCFRCRWTFANKIA